MNQELKQKWLAALRSGEYKQGMKTLHNLKDDTFCCLGVLCDLQKSGDWVEVNNMGVISIGDEIVGESGWANFGDNSSCLDVPEGFPDLYIQQKIATKNDEGYSFEEIADWIEKNV